MGAVIWTPYHDAHVLRGQYWSVVLVLSRYPSIVILRTGNGSQHISGAPNLVVILLDYVSRSVSGRPSPLHVRCASTRPTVVGCPWADGGWPHWTNFFCSITSQKVPLQAKLCPQRNSARHHLCKCSRGTPAQPHWEICFAAILLNVLTSLRGRGGRGIRVLAPISGCRNHHQVIWLALECLETPWPKTTTMGEIFPSSVSSGPGSACHTIQYTGNGVGGGLVWLLLCLLNRAEHSAVPSARANCLGFPPRAW